MYMTPAQAQSTLTDHICVSTSIRSLYDEDLFSDRTEPLTLLVVEGALANGDVRRHFADPRWPLDLITGMAFPPDHYWRFAERQDLERPLDPGDLGRIAAACGIDGRPGGNVRCTWWIRRYDERVSLDGGLEWFSRVLARQTAVAGIARSILTAIVGLLSSVREGGGEILVEQLTIILAKDPADELRTLTPHLHADEYYGHRETAICSLLEEGWNPHGGTLFLPTRRMADLDALGTFDVGRIERELSGEPILTPASGDVLIYDGMIGSDGRIDRRLGVPHISADVPGRSARLVMLMRHRNPVSRRG